jgi:hypothetical protein
MVHRHLGNGLGSESGDSFENVCSSIGLAITEQANFAMLS